jgi:WD40 repeat protein
MVLMSQIAQAEEGRAEGLYQQHCSTCHGINRLGGAGPALLPQNLRRLKRKAAVGVITNGAPATQMPAFGTQLTTADIDALVEYVYQPLAYVPDWGEQQIRSSRILQPTRPDPSAAPVYTSDPLNLFVVVEAGDHHATILDGDTFEPIHRFKTRHALHGGPKFSSDGRYVYFASRDGWISKFDMYRLETVAEIRAGINTRNLAVSSDNRYVLVGNYLPHNLVLLDAVDLSLMKIIPVNDGLGNSSRVSAVYDAPPRQSFIVALKDFTEVWEIPYMDDPPVYGWQHDYRYEADKPVKFPVRRIPLDDYLDDFFFDQTYDYLIGAARNAKNGQVVDLVVGKKVADIDLPGMPHLGSGITWKNGDTVVLASPNLKENVISVIDMGSWKTIKRIDTLGPGFFMRSHKNSDYAWVDVFFGPNKDVVHVIDKKSFEIVKTLKPEPGKTAAHVEFTRDGRYALLSIWDMDGAVIVYDAKSLQEIKRIPMVKPSGKYNVYNKITKEEGTSH